MAPKAKVSRAEPKGSASSVLDLTAHLPQAQEWYEKYVKEKKKATKSVAGLPDKQAQLVKNTIAWAREGGGKLLAATQAAEAGGKHEAALAVAFAYASVVLDILDDSVKAGLYTIAPADRNSLSNAASDAAEALRQPAASLQAGCGQRSLAADALHLKLLDTRIALLTAGGYQYEPIVRNLQSSVVIVAMQALADGWEGASGPANPRLKDSKFVLDSDPKRVRIEAARRARDIGAVFGKHRTKVPSQLMKEHVEGAVNAGKAALAAKEVADAADAADRAAAEGKVGGAGRGGAGRGGRGHGGRQRGGERSRRAGSNRTPAHPTTFSPHPSPPLPPPPPPKHTHRQTTHPQKLRDTDKASKQQSKTQRQKVQEGSKEEEDDQQQQHPQVDAATRRAVAALEQLWREGKGYERNQRRAEEERARLQDLKVNAEKVGAVPLLPRARGWAPI
jgi:hypothetical protein